MYISQAFTDYEGYINSKKLQSGRRWYAPTCVTPGVNARGHFGYFGFLCTVFGFLCDLLDSSMHCISLHRCSIFSWLKKKLSSPTMSIKQNQILKCVLQSLNACFAQIKLCTTFCHPREDHVLMLSKQTIVEVVWRLTWWVHKAVVPKHWSYQISNMGSTEKLWLFTFLFILTNSVGFHNSMSAER